MQIEKYCVRKSRSYKLQNNFLFLPAVEALYVWGMFVLLDVEVAQVKPWARGLGAHDFRSSAYGARGSAQWEFRASY